MVLVLLGILAGVVGVASRAPARPPAEPVSDTITRMRRAAIDDGIPISRTLHLANRVLATATASPDGSVVGDPVLGVDRLTGAIGATGVTAGVTGGRDADAIR